jgi:hypothetical protein
MKREHKVSKFKKGKQSLPIDLMDLQLMVQENEK